MSLIATAQADIKRFTSDATGFGIPIRFENPVNSQTATVNGLYTQHHLGYNTDGEMVSSRNVHISVSEELLTTAGYIVRDSSNRVALKDHYVAVTDVNGTDLSYIIREVMPSDTVGFIVCILGLLDT